MKLRMLLLFVFVLFSGVAGCETLKGGTEGFVKDIENTSENIPDFWAHLKKADVWIQERLW